MKLSKKQTELFVKTSFDATPRNFNFEEWAGEVKKQMIAALGKRTIKRQLKG